MLKCSFPMTASVQESLENHFKQHPIPIKQSAEFIIKIAVSTSVFENFNPGDAKTPHYQFIHFIKRIIGRTVTALFTNMRTLKFIKRLHNCVFAAVNHNYNHKKQTLKHRNTHNGSKSTNHRSQTMTF